MEVDIQPRAVPHSKSLTRAIGSRSLCLGGSRVLLHCKLGLKEGGSPDLYAGKDVEKNSAWEVLKVIMSPSISEIHDSSTLCYEV